jgi:hypothetical protein
MDALPPNDPNQNNNQARRKDAAAQADAPMDVMGDLRDAPVVVVMFLIGVASWLLRERCIC